MNAKALIFPICAEIALIIACIVLPHRTLEIYTLFYAALLAYYFRWISLRKVKNRITKGRHLWIPMLLTLAAAALVQLLSSKMVTASYMDGRIAIWQDGSAFNIALFALLTVLLRPGAEELFFRKALISFDSKKATVITAVVSVVLNALAHTDFTAYPTSLIFFGFLKSALIVLPFTLGYVKTRSVSVSFLGHVCFDLLQDLPSIVYDIARFTLR